MRLRHNGLTLIELIVVIAIVAVLAAIGIPGFTNFIQSNSLSTQTNELIAGLAYARNEAVRQNRPIAFCRSDNATSATPSCTATATGAWAGWIIFSDVNNNGTYDSGTDSLIRRGQLTNSSVQILSSAAIGAAANTVVYRGDSLARNNAGALLNAGRIRACVVASLNGNARDIELRAGGKAILDAPATSATCAAPAD